MRLALVCLMFVLEGAMAQMGPPAYTSAENLMVVLRESVGANTKVESLDPWGKVRMKRDQCRRSLNTFFPTRASNKAGRNGLAKA